MEFTRRQFGHFASTSLLVVASLLSTVFGASAAPAEEPDFNKSEQDVVTKMTEAGYAHFALLNKATATFYLVQNGDPFLKTPAIYGREDKNKSITPNGIFSLKNEFHGEALPKMVFGFDKNSGLTLLLHGLVPGREQALASDNMQGRKLSEGCVNLPPQKLPIALAFIRQRARSNPDGNALPFVIIDKNYSGVGFDKSLREFKPLTYNRNLY
jgi:hypothetical protein